MADRSAAYLTRETPARMTTSRWRRSQRRSGNGAGRRRCWWIEKGTIIAGHGRVLAARQAWPAGSARHGRARLERGAEAGLRARRQQAGGECRLGQANPRCSRSPTSSVGFRPLADRLLGSGADRRFAAAQHQGLTDPDDIPEPPVDPVSQHRRRLAAGPHRLALRRQHRCGRGDEPRWPASRRI